MAKSKRSRTLAEQIADLDGPAPKDFDPEEPDTFASGSDNSDDDNDNTDAAREHYVQVEESKLRKKDAAPLGPKYKGSRVSRDDIEDDESDDPFGKGFEDQSDDEEDAKDSSMSGAGTEDEDEEQSGRSAENEEDEEQSGRSAENEEDEEDAASRSSDDDEDEDENMDAAKSAKGALDRSELRKIVSEEQKTVAAMLSEAARADAEKGRAVKAQRKTFDSLLNTRIRLQKALVATNSMFAQQAADSSDIRDDPVRAAEEAACNLWNTLNGLRESLYTSRTGEKRKSVEISTSSPVQEAWSQMNSYEDATAPNRHAILEKWNAKARGITALPTKSKLNNTAQQGLVDILASQLADSTRLVQKTRMPRSCAPVQANTGVTESADIFDDADFYGLLLKELLERRSEESASGALAGMSFNVPHWQAAREAKTKKQVDTRASKGRKLRYTVHEKLQNFMAPEDRGAWGERQAEELFTSLLGRKVGLTEDAVEDEERSEDEDLGAQGLLLFGGSK